ncbi:nitroreductase family protein [Actinomycetes bacterium KLBMP 9759]
MADASVLAAVVTDGDARVDQLQAGEATSAVLLAATRSGLATTPLSQVTEMAGSRTRLRQDVLRSPEHPQLLVRVGWPRSGQPLVPRTPRRALHLVLDGASDGALGAHSHQGGSP